MTGPTIAGCSYAAGGASLSVTFDAALLAGGALTVLAYDQPKQSAFSVLVNSSDDAGSGTWVPVNIALGPAGSSSVTADLAPLGGAAPQAIKYAWGATGGRPNEADVICCHSLGAAAECVPGQCPIFVAMPLAPFGGLPANPFLAKISAQGKCECPAPQVCDA